MVRQANVPIASAMLSFAVALITGVLVVLKLADIINWSWWWVLSPLLGFLAIQLVLGLMLVLLALRLLRSVQKWLAK